MVEKAVPILCGVLTFLSGCSWGLKHPDMRIESTLTAADLTDRIELGVEELRHVDTAASVGRFPAGIAIVRLAKTLDERTQTGRLSILPLRGFEVPYWSQLFDGTSQVRSLFAIHEKSVRDKYVTLPELCEAAHVLSAGLLLIYGYDNTSTKDTCRVFGLVFEIPSRKLLAGIASRATLADARAAVGELPHRAKPSGADDWAFYIDHLAFRGLEQTFKKCDWDLIDRDHKPEILKPNPFENAKLPYPLGWFPIR